MAAPGDGTVDVAVAEGPVAVGPVAGGPTNPGVWVTEGSGGPAGWPVEVQPAAPATATAIAAATTVASDRRIGPPVRIALRSPG